MKKLLVGLMVGGLLTVAIPARAQFGDPLSLAAAGVLIPFFGNGANGDVSFLELAAPVGGANIHMIFYDAACTRVISLAETLTANDLTIVPIAPLVSDVNGLIAIAWTATGNELIPLASAIHSRVYWINVVSGRARILEPITLATYQVAGATTWNPLRSGATFFAPQETAGVHTVVYLICPKDTIQGGAGPPAPAFPPGLFPTIVPPFLAEYEAGSIAGRIYDLNETLLANVVTDCDCLKVHPVTDFDGGSVYSFKATYTELQASPTGGFSFTGYKAIQVTSPPADFFGRLSNASGMNLINGTPGINGNR